MKVRIDLDYLEHRPLQCDRDIAYLVVSVVPSLDRVLRVMSSSNPAELGGQAAIPSSRARQT